MKKIICFTFYLLFVLIPAGFSAESIPKVLCFGDSITQGTWINGKYEVGNSWVNILQENSKGKLITINAGLSGRKTSDKEQLLDYVEKYKDVEYAIIFLGVNDLCNSNEKTLNSCIDNIKWMINALRTKYKTVRITVLSSPGINVKTIKSAFIKLGYDEKEQVLLNRLRLEYKKLCEETDSNFIDLWGVVSSENYYDGLHPNIEGEKQIADVVWADFQIFYKL